MANFRIRVLLSSQTEEHKGRGRPGNEANVHRYVDELNCVTGKEWQAFDGVSVPGRGWCIKNIES